ncbi:polymer-forming cytoskeletal protein [uncultured Clostridium sp.]|jgi:cytoskeletal protein CcmA (bactofilin family)|uniref:polymer-forming cytoskeletal protein n=1 Tax=uncultured Clostridium sp. TaxID=59620 RepID=UPI002629CC19|nr:polymer-forming cytoskeletal protein [uncultured Clostridium sp.]
MKELSGSLEVKAFETVDGGSYNDVIMSGMGKIKGNIEATVVEVNGVGEITGDIKSESLMVAGSFTADKEVVLEGMLNIKGTASFSKTLICEEIIVAGSLSVKGDIKFTDASISGALISRGILTGDKVEVAGGVDMSSDLRVNYVNISFSEKSSVNDILADEVYIETMEGKKGLFSKLKKTVFKCNEIRAEKVFVENTECKLIVADEVIIGENCKVEKVEYLEKFEFAKSSEVKETVCKK